MGRSLSLVQMGKVLNLLGMLVVDYLPQILPRETIELDVCDGSASKILARLGKRLQTSYLQPISQMMHHLDVSASKQRWDLFTTRQQLNLRTYSTWLIESGGKVKDECPPSAKQK